MTNNKAYEKQMPETRRTNPGFLSNNEAARDKQRTGNFVKGLLTSKELEEKTRKLKSKQQQINQTSRPIINNSEEKEIVSIGPEFWRSNKALIVRAIVLNQAYNREDILRVTKLTDTQYRSAMTALLEVGLITQKYPNNFWVSKELYVQCKNRDQRTL